MPRKHAPLKIKDTLISQKVAQACRKLTGAWGGAGIGVVLGSGWSGLVGEIREKKSFPYSSIPNFPKSTVEGHKGDLIFGTLQGVPVAVMSGRFHYYEGYSLQEVTFPIRVLAALGIKTLVLTNAAGGIAPSLRPGHFMVIRDHLNFIPDNPLRGAHEASFGQRFVSLADTYDASLRRLALQCAKKVKVEAREGIYMALPGPTYETPAEIRVFRSFGASAIGMSTVPEAIVAKQAGLSVLALSLITNVHGNGESPTHKEVLDTARKFESKFKAFLKCVVSRARK